MASAHWRAASVVQVRGAVERCQWRATEWRGRDVQIPSAGGVENPKTPLVSGTMSVRMGARRGRCRSLRRFAVVSRRTKWRTSNRRIRRWRRTSATVGTELTFGRLSFHDERGFIIDPVAVAAMFRDLMLNGFPALLNKAAALPDLEATGSLGGLGRIAGLASGTRVHIVNPFGGAWVNPASGAGLRIGSSGTALDGALHDWASDTLQSTVSTASNLRFGFSPEGLLGSSALSIPTFPTTNSPAGSNAPSLGRQFFRVVALDLGLHLRGNRGSSALEGVPGADELSQLEPAPLVRDNGTLQPEFDGQATMGAVTEIGASTGLVLAVSPAIATDVAFPANQTSRWPAVPAPASTAEDLSAQHSARARSEATAAYVGDSNDVVVTWPARLFAE